MNRPTRKAQREALLRDMAAVAAALEGAAGGELPAATLRASMASGSDGERRVRLRRFTNEGWIDPVEEGTAWIRGDGTFRLGAVRLWRLELDDLDAGDRRRP
jgi:hypothetical protein